MTTWTVPPELEDAVLGAARAIVGDAALAPAALHKAIVDRSERYTSDRDRLAKPANPTADLAARAAFFTIADAIKIAIPIAELRRAALLPDRALKVVDLGAGCGAMGLGLASQGISLDYTAFDRDDKALAIAKRALATYAPTSSLTTRACDVTREPIPACDLVTMATLLNELPLDQRLPLVARALAAAPTVIIIEPALRDTTRALHELRDQLIANGAFVLAPCTRAIAPCPALAAGDWCHEERLVRLPPHTAELARVTHLRDGNLKFSYLVLRRDPIAARPTEWRIVDHPVAPKGRVEVLGCSDAGRTLVRLMRRHRDDSNKAFERARRGDIIVTSDQPDDKRLELTGPLSIKAV